MENLESILKDFEKRLSSIEAVLKPKEPSTEGPAPQYYQHSQEEEVAGPASLSPTKEAENEVTPQVSYQVHNHQTRTSNSLDSSSVLAYIGIIFVVLAGIFFIKITIDSGWLTPIRQVLLAAATGLAFFLLPHFFPRAERQYGSLLAGAGITILHLSWLGAYFYHDILSANVALISATLVGLFSVFASFDHNNRAYLLVAMAGTYLSAPIIGYQTGELSILSIFLVIWNISFSTASILNKRRDILFIASYYSVFTVLLLSGKTKGVEQNTELLVLQIIQFFIFAAAMVSYTAHHKSPLTRDESNSIYPLLLLFYFSTGHLLSIIFPNFASWFGITIGVMVLGIYLIAGKLYKGELQSGPALASFSATTFVHSAFFLLLDESMQPLVGLLIGISVLLFASKNPSFSTRYRWPLLILFSTFCYGALISTLSLGSDDFVSVYNLSYGAIALFAVTQLRSAKGATQDFSKYLPAILGFAHFEIMLSLYRFSKEVAWSGSLFLTLAWGLYAGLILGLAYWRRDRVLGNSALTILLAVSLKAFFYDVASTSSIIRVICLLAEGLLLYGCGWIFKKMQEWSPQSDSARSDAIAQEG